MQEAWAYYAMKREIARLERGNFRGVCPVSDPFPIRNRAAEIDPIHAYIARTEDEKPAEKPVCFSDAA